MIDSAVLEGRWLVQVVDSQRLAYVPVTLQQMKHVVMTFNPADIRYLDVGETGHLVPLTQHTEDVLAIIKQSI